MKTHNLDPADPIAILGSLTTYRLACNANRIHEREAMWAMPHFVADQVASSLNDRMVQADEIKGMGTTVNSNGTALHVHRLRLYSEVVNHLLKWNARDETIAEADATILRYMQPSNMTPLQYGEAFFVKAICVGDVYNKGTLNDALIQEVDKLNLHSLRGYLATHPHADLTDLALHAQSFLAIQGSSIKKKGLSQQRHS